MLGVKPCFLFATSNTAFPPRHLVSEEHHYISKAASAAPCCGVRRNDRQALAAQILEQEIWRLAYAEE